MNERTEIKKIQRNERCACGSGLKFKKCCIHTKGKGAKVTRKYRTRQ